MILEDIAATHAIYEASVNNESSQEEKKQLIESSYMSEPETVAKSTGKFTQLGRKNSFKKRVKIKRFLIN